MALFFSSALVDAVAILATCYLALRLYMSHAYNYWKKRCVYCAQSASMFGSVKDVVLRREHMSDMLLRAYEQSPGQPYVGLYVGRKPVLMVKDLDLLRCVFVKDAQAFIDRSDVRPVRDGHKVTTQDLFIRSLFMLSGHRWRALRIKLTPTFTSGKIKKMFHLIEACGKQLVPCIERETSKAGEMVVVKELVARYSTDVIASCAFGVDANALADPNSEFRTTMRKMFEPKLRHKMAGMINILMPGIRKLLRLEFIDPTIYDFIRQTFWDVVDYRNKNKVVRDDFVDLLVQIKKEGQVRADDAKDLEEIERDNAQVGKASKADKDDIDLDENDILAQAFIFIVAGFETSSSVITQTLYELALHPDIQDRLRREIQNVLDKHKNEVTYEAIAEMSYLEMVASETMRKYPTLPTLERVCVSDYKVPGSDFTIEKGTKIMIPIRAIHNDPDIYPDPQRFDPERFSAENKRTRSNFAHLPFGEGPRICIGMRFGQMQVKTALVHVITSFQVSPCKETPTPPLRLKSGSGVFTPRQDIVLAFTKLEKTREE